MEGGREERVDVCKAGLCAASKQRDSLHSPWLLPLPSTAFLPWFMDHWPSSLCQSSRYISELLFNAYLLSVLFAVINLFLYYGVLGGLNFTLDDSLKEEIKRRKRNFPARFLLAQLKMNLIPTRKFIKLWVIPC